MTQKLWGGRFEGEPSPFLRRLNDSFAFDRELFDDDVEGSIAWARALADVGVLTDDEVDAILGALTRIEAPAGGDLRRRPFVRRGEALRTDRRRRRQAAHRPLAQRSGRDRSQTLAEARLQRSDRCGDRVDRHARAIARPTKRRRRCPATRIPNRRSRSRSGTGASRTSRCCAATARASPAPSSAATNVRSAPARWPARRSPIDRDELARSLGFARATANSIDAVSDRDFAAEYLFASALLLTHLSRLAEDLIFFTTDEAAYAELPDAMATGSSRMPQKKNPDVLELARGYAARAIGELTGFIALLKGLPLAYDKDLQLDKEPLFRTRAVIALAASRAQRIDRRTVARSRPHARRRRRRCPHRHRRRRRARRDRDAVPRSARSGQPQSRRLAIARDSSTA